mmetsp:Transcript_41844/g.107067  ORF Transcript_41844/g.107067 Transcript_41844/m.107067 type:complete len:252 (-) Transcript_41844:1010-1765(-)
MPILIGAAAVELGAQDDDSRLQRARLPRREPRRAVAVAQVLQQAGRRDAPLLRALGHRRRQMRSEVRGDVGRPRRRGGRVRVDRRRNPHVAAQVEAGPLGTLRYRLGISELGPVRAQSRQAIAPVRPSAALDHATRLEDVRVRRGLGGPQDEVLLLERHLLGVDAAKDLRALRRQGRRPVARLVLRRVHRRVGRDAVHARQAYGGHVDSAVHGDPHRARAHLRRRRRGIGGAVHPARLRGLGARQRARQPA